MSNAPTSSSPESSTGSVDREALYGEYLRNARWRDDLNRRFTHKALDLPLDDMQIHVNRENGIGWRELAVLGVFLVLAAWLLGTWFHATPAPSQPPPAIERENLQSPDTNSWFELRLKEGDNRSGERG